MYNFFEHNLYKNNLINLYKNKLENLRTSLLKQSIKDYNLTNNNFPIIIIPEKIKHINENNNISGDYDICINKKDISNKNIKTYYSNKYDIYQDLLTLEIDLLKNKIDNLKEYFIFLEYEKKEDNEKILFTKTELSHLLKLAYNKLITKTKYKKYRINKQKINSFLKKVIEDNEKSNISINNKNTNNIKDFIIYDSTNNYKQILKEEINKCYDLLPSFIKIENNDINLIIEDKKDFIINCISHFNKDTNDVFSNNSSLFFIRNITIHSLDDSLNYFKVILPSLNNENDQENKIISNINQELFILLKLIDKYNILLTYNNHSQIDNNYLKEILHLNNINKRNIILCEKLLSEKHNKINLGNSKLIENTINKIIIETNIKNEYIINPKNISFYDIIKKIFLKNIIKDFDIYLKYKELKYIKK